MGPKAQVTSYSADVQQGSSKNTHRTAAIARTAVRRLHKPRCPPCFCFGT